MHYCKPFILLLLGGIIITGCSSNRADQPKIADKPAPQLYEEVQAALDKANYDQAVGLLEALDTRYPFGPYSTQVQLDLIYSYYKSNDSAKGIANIDRFLRNNPGHQDLDYIYYMRGLTNMAADYNGFQSILGIERFDRDPKYSREAFDDFNTLLKRYPNSPYAADAHQRMIELKNKLANYETSVARYYIKREAYIAAVNRARYVIENFSDTLAAQSALQIMQEGYHELGLTELAERAEKILQHNTAKS
jgi:outer membrane protein assembly factor BamD